MVDTNVRLQNLRDFTVQIRNADDKIIGTGIAVSMDGQIVTCAHVVEAAGVNPRAAGNAEISIYFPQLQGAEEKKRKAVVAKFFAEHDDDVVLLQITDGAAPLAPGKIAILGTADESQGNLFRAYGYRRLDKYIAGWADGKIHGSVEIENGGNYCCEPVQIESNQITYGMSGSAVLDTTRNLVVGIMSEVWFPDASSKDRDTAWAVNGEVLSFEPLNLPLHDRPLPLRPAYLFRPDAEMAEKAVATAVTALEQRREKVAWNQAPQLLPDFIGRADLLAALEADFSGGQKHVAGLIGLGGEGKSSLARQWVGDVLRRGESEIRSDSAPDGIFWWSFSANASADEFLEAALEYLSAGQQHLRNAGSTYQCVQTIGAMLKAGRFLFVLDGLEAIQYLDGDDYGLLQNQNVRDLLALFASPDNPSFCLVTSRAPLLDLMDYVTYTHHEVERLSADDGRALLRKMGVQGDEAALDRLVANWDGHALTLGLLGALLRDEYDGEANALTDVEAPLEGSQRFVQVKNVLKGYHDILSNAERGLLMLLSLFYEPVPQTTLLSFIKEHDYPASLCEPIARLQPEQFAHMVEKLARAHLLRFDSARQQYFPHALVKSYYHGALLRGDSTASYSDAVEDIANYYGRLARESKKAPENLLDLKPQIEAVKYYCRCERYDEAFKILFERLANPNNPILTHVLGAYDALYNLLLTFFPKGDTNREPLVEKLWIFSGIGSCLSGLGSLREAAPFYKRAASLLETQDWHNACGVYHNLAVLHTALGALETSAKAARQALDLARRAKNKRDEKNLLSDIAWTEHLLGNSNASTSNFMQVEKLEQEEYFQQNVRYSFSMRGVQHADHLRLSGLADYAFRVTDANLQICERNQWPDKISQCHRILGDLDADAGNHESARAHYESALKIARGISYRAALIEALLARGRWQAKDFRNLGDFGSLEQAFSDLNEALNYAVEGGYRIYEADIRVALGWAHFASYQCSVGSDQSAGAQSAIPNLQSARAEAERALQMSTEMGYYWGKVDAEAVLKQLP